MTRYKLWQAPLEGRENAAFHFQEVHVAFVGGVYSPYRPKTIRKKGKQTRSRANFIPTEQQVVSGAGRIVGLLKHHHGMFPCIAAEDSTHKELVPLVYNRGVSLGRTPHEVSQTLLLSLALLKSQSKVRFEQDSSGRLHLLLKGWEPGKVHKDKYQNQRSRRRGLRAA